MKYILIIFTFCLNQLIFAQKEDSLILVIDQVEIATITSPEAIKSYFNDISKLNRSIKNTETIIVDEFGFKSPEHDSILTVQESINDDLLLKMREYLSFHPYPKKRPGDSVRSEENNEILYVGQDVIGSSTLIKVFVSASKTQKNLDLKKLYFPTFYQAFQQGDIYSGDLWNLLHGMYRQVKNEEYSNFEMGEDEQIEKMIDDLQLDRKAPN